ncbi:MAG: AAA family ATPase [Caldilineaceae bacterium]
MLKPLPVGLQTFRDLIGGGFLYVDKTTLIYELIRNPKGVYFLARPRRFGKSLLVSTLEEIFLGNRELFQGLWLYDSPYVWEKHPVVRIDFSLEPVKSAQELMESIQRAVRRVAMEYAVTLQDGPYYAQWQELIYRLAAEKHAVVLIDEYDKPLIDNLQNLAEVQQIREVLKGFYGVLKGMDRYLRFVFLTGISKFSKVGIFSGLNNLQDLSMDDRYAALPGITQTELETELYPYVQRFATHQGITVETALAQIRLWYNGFRFTKADVTLYNPFSLVYFFDVQDFRNYWFDSGTPTFLVNLIQQQKYKLEEVQQRKVGELAFSTYELEHLAVLPLLYQTGYLTIKGYDPEQRLYELGYPNREVEDAFLTYILGSFSQVEPGLNEAYLWQLVDALRAGKLEEFFEVLNIFFAHIPYTLQIKREQYYQTIFYLIFTLIGLRTQAEVITNRGRIDAVVEVATAIYLFEFKLNGSETEALAQIKTTEYYQRYQRQGKPLHLVGVNFSTRKRGVAKWCEDQLA